MHTFWLPQAARVWGLHEFRQNLANEAGTKISVESVHMGRPNRHDVLKIQSEITMFVVIINTTVNILISKLSVYTQLAFGF